MTHAGNMQARCMDCGWNMHELCVGYEWPMHGLCMEHACIMPGRTDYVWVMRGWDNAWMVR